MPSKKSDVIKFLLCKKDFFKNRNNSKFLNA